MKITSLNARRILDSRGAWTVEVMLETKDGIRAVASAPQGKSTGSSEARALAAPQAIRNVNERIAPWMKRKILRTRFPWMCFCANWTERHRKQSSARTRHCRSPWHLPAPWHSRKEYRSGNTSREQAGSGAAAKGQLAHPRLFINVVNGGLHAGNDLNFQEYLIIPRCRTIRESIDIGVKVYHALGTELERMKGRNAANLGDEGGFAPNFKNDIEPFRIIGSVAKKLHLAHKIDFGMDAAATDIKKISDKKLAATYIKLVRDHRLIYIEDPFSEKDFLAFTALNMHFKGKVWIAGDDLTTTNVRNIKKAHDEESVNAVIIKPNQIGTVTETLAAVQLARKYGWAVVASHRSGRRTMISSLILRMASAPMV